MAGVIPRFDLGGNVRAYTVAVLVIVFPNIAPPGKATTLKEKFLVLRV